MSFKCDVNLCSYGMGQIDVSVIPNFEIIGNVSYHKSYVKKFCTVSISISA